MNTVTKQELSKVLHEITKLLSISSTTDIPVIANVLAHTVATNLQAPEIGSTWVNNQTNFEYQVVGISIMGTLTDGYPNTVYLHNSNSNQGMTRGIVDFYSSFSEVVNKPVIPKLGTKWSNNKSGNMYEIVGLSNLKSTSEDFPATVIYNCAHGNTWSRTLTSFLLKFTEV